MDKKCEACPRKCRAVRPNGFCRVSDEYVVSRAALHMYEEPPISGERGSGTIFFSGCNLGCIYCQNRDVSRGKLGETVDDSRLERIIFELEEQGAHNINLVTPSHYFHRLPRLLEKIKHRLTVPIVCNCGGYESVEALKSLCGLVDVYLPDFKYYSSELSAKYSKAPDYFSVACDAVFEMHRQQPKPIFGKDGMLKGGLVVRHLVLPGCRKDSVRVLEELAKLLPKESFLLSLMSQYTPDFVDVKKYPELARRVTTFEYESVKKKALELGFDGFFQSRSSATSDYTPNFKESKL